MAMDFGDFYVDEEFQNLDFGDDLPVPIQPEFDLELNTDQTTANCEAVIVNVEEATNDEHGEGGRNSVVLEDATNAPPKKRAKTHKKAQPKRTQLFKLDDATAKATEYVTTVLKEIPTDPLFCKPFKNVLLALALVTSLITLVGDEMFAEFCAFIVIRMWQAITAGDSRPLSYAQTLVTHFHDLCTDEQLLDRWESLLNGLGISCGQLQSDVILQHIMDKLLEKLLSDRNAVDLPTIEENIRISAINKHEEQVLNYVGGYIPFAMLKHYRKLVNNVTATKYVNILSSWCTDGPYERQYSFLEYTREWIQAQNRGKLFQPKPQLFLFFKAMENETRKHLNTALINQYRDMDLRELLIEKLSTKHIVQHYWAILIGGKGLSSDESKHLFYVTVNYFVNIRIRAFVIVYTDLKKVHDKSLSRKGAKSLRQQLN
ncbi:uncharacterized protein [Amphiura filiformis]|uniref:uncharacterized protein n=1 Tax=Amphiura filiformis TaxID=82378 RepID=UPI003B224C0A